ncbi:MAG: cobyric acid synthase, partial [Candidatus Omnitrophota bacterium]
MKKTKVLHVCGTGSGVGKSIIVAGLCRIFKQEGYNVCPFKAQNMALNSFITKEGGEIGRAQAVQAQAAKIQPSVDMNPVLMKPTSDRKAQIIVRGKAIGNMDVLTYVNYKKELIKTVCASYQRLRKKYDLIIMEGAGSPAEINLKQHDIVNMKMAQYAKAPVILVGDIDKGGVFAWLCGTLDLLTKNERKHVKGLLINKFRGDRRLLSSGINFLEKKTEKKVLGIIPYFKNIRIPEEDSIPLNEYNNSKTTRDITISVIHLPHISNFTDMDPFQKEKDVSIKYVNEPQQLKMSDIIIIPGTKNTLADLAWLKKANLAAAIKANTTATFIIGICGGFQMLGNTISDPLNVESRLIKNKGLSLLNITTSLGQRKVTHQIKGKELSFGIDISGYEIHHGKTKIDSSVNAFCEITQRGNKSAKILDGARSQD